MVSLRWQEEIPEKTVKFSEILLRNINHSAAMYDIISLFICATTEWNDTEVKE